MPKTYSAILKGNRLEWVGEVPATEIEERAVAVEVTITQDSPIGLVDAEERRRILTAALNRIAARGTLAGINDSVEWQREVREDRSLLGRV